MLTAMRCKEPDVLPIHIRGVLAWNEEWVATRHPSYKPVIEIVAEHGDYQAAWSPGTNQFITASEDFSTTTERTEDEDWIYTKTTLHTPKGDMTSAYRTSKRGLPGMQMEFYVKQPEDVQKVLSIPYVPPQPDCSGFFELDKKIGDRGIVMASIYDPIAYVHDLLGSETIALWSILHRDLLMELLEVFTERLTDLVKYMLSQGVGPVFSMLGEEYVAPPLHGAADFKAFCTDFEPRITRPVHEAGGLWHIHCHGSLNDFLEDFITIGANCLHPLEAPPMGNVTLADGKRRLGGKVCIEGNIQIGDIYHAPTEQIVQQVKECIDIAAPGGGYILGVSASPHTEVLTDQTVKNYVALVETAVEYGR